MRTLKEYQDFLFNRGYTLEPAPYTFLDNSLEAVCYQSTLGKTVTLWVFMTPEYEEKLKALPEGTEYELDETGYEVTGAHIVCNICNQPGFYDGDVSGITLVSEPGDYNKDTLDLFEYCLGLQEEDLTEHEVRMMEAHLEHVLWAAANLTPVLKAADYKVTESNVLNINVEERPNSNLALEYTHYNGDEISLETHCITGAPLLYPTCLQRAYGLPASDVKEVIRQEIWEKPMVQGGTRPNPKYEYLVRSEPRLDKDTFAEVFDLITQVKDKRIYREPDWSHIPDEYNHLKAEWEQLRCSESSQKPTPTT